MIAMVEGVIGNMPKVERVTGNYYNRDTPC